MREAGEQLRTSQLGDSQQIQQLVEELRCANEKHSKTEKQLKASQDKESDMLQGVDFELAEARAELSAISKQVSQLQGEVQELQDAKLTEIGIIMEAAAQQQKLTASETAKRDVLLAEVVDMSAQFEASQQAAKELQTEVTVREQQKSDLTTQLQQLNELVQEADKQVVLDNSKHQALLDDLEVLGQEIAAQQLQLSQRDAALAAQIQDLSSVER